MNDIKFIKGQGGMGRVAASEDVISGLIVSAPAINSDQLSADGFEDLGSNVYCIKLQYPEQLAMCGIVEMSLSSEDVMSITNAEYKNRAVRNRIVYDVFEFFRMSPSGVLYLMIAKVLNITSIHVQQIQGFSGGKLRQIGILTNNLSNIADYQIVCTGGVGIRGFEAEHQPASIIVACAGLHDDVATTGAGSVESPYVHTISNTSGFAPITLDYLKTESIVSEGRANLSVIVACDLNPKLTQKLGHYAYYGCIGLALGAVSNAMVHECIAWVQKFPLALSMPGLISGELIKQVSTIAQELINANRYIFVRIYAGKANNYFNDSHTLDITTSDYAYIENVRTIDKAIRGIYQQLLPSICSPVLIDAETGKLPVSTVAVFENEANKPLEDMEKAGELSGYRVKIDPDQNILATSQIEFQIRKVAVGVVRRMNVRIGYTTKL